MSNYAYLVFVEAQNNHNKFYEMTMHDDDSIDVNYGRIGNNVTHHHYAPYEKNWSALYYSKIRKGYMDMTDLHKDIEKTSDTQEYKEIDDEKIKEFVDALLKKQKKIVDANYVSPTQATQEMIDSARHILLNLSDCIQAPKDKWEQMIFISKFNRQLEEVFSIMPRKMGRVEDFLLEDIKDIDNILLRENDLLDNLEGTIGNTQIQKNQNKPDFDGTILQANGITMNRISYKEEEAIWNKMGQNVNRYKSAFAIVNEDTQKKYDDFVKDNHISSKGQNLLWHGSPSKNWWGIATKGLSTKFSANGMFGYGLYFAPKAEKSMGYMSTGSYWRGGNDSTGYLALFQVATGKSYQPTHPLYGFRYNDLQNGCQSVWAYPKNTSLLNEEVIVYKDNQATVKYIVEVYAREKNIDLSLDARNIHLAGEFDCIEKTSDGYTARLLCENLDDTTLSLLHGFDSEEIYFDVDSSGKKLSVHVIDGSSNKEPALTGYDKAFLLRELKKSFFEGDKQWEEFINDTQKEKAGTILKGEKIAFITYSSIRENTMDDYDIDER